MSSRSGTYLPSIPLTRHLLQRQGPPSCEDLERHQLPDFLSCLLRLSRRFIPSERFEFLEILHN
jgi:hypothetical protein